MSTLTIAYFTNRKQPMIQWFFDSLHRETGGDYTGIKVLVVDFWALHGADVAPRGDWAARNRIEEGGGTFRHTEPKPTVWAGKHRLTKADYFAAANARNTALCLAPDGYLVGVDDLSILMPGWLAAVREAQAGNYVVCGAYRKMNKMQVENGELKFCEGFPAGDDHRIGVMAKMGKDLTRPIEITWGEWFFGCSCGAPVEALLDIGGWPEICDSCAAEDNSAGLMLKRRGNRFFYDHKMMTYESEEMHAQLPVFIREDPCKGDPSANPRDDMSHALLRILSGDHHPGYFGEGGIRALRQRILAGEPFPITNIPEHRFFDGVPLRDLPLPKS